MNNLVVLRDRQAVTDSLKVAEVFEKQHRHVLEKARNLTAENSAVKNMFVETTYINKRGQKQPIIYMNRDGFTLIAMGFTGKKAMEFKLKYIEAFNKMEQQIRNQSERPKLMQKERIEISRQNAETRKASLLYRIAKSMKDTKKQQELLTQIANNLIGEPAKEIKPKLKNFHTANEVGKLFGTNGWGIEQMAQKLKLQAPVPESNRFGKWIQNGDFPEWLYTDAAIQQIEQYGFLIR
ncbi:MAG: Rha family transcriptional regulator [Lactobacillus johnsonii]|nr:Rha family transcriptional regulator [Lactobacillus johnsonii]MDY5351679.1 Rha family transcriptional regulator [Lactobacillus johnsonii]MDY5419642.1 Rha family transcriptional regulator [Lactobacillus johnsonii]